MFRSSNLLITFGSYYYSKLILLSLANLSVIVTATCYKKVMTETKEMQDAIVNDLGLNPVEKDVVVLYDGEKNDEMAEYWKVCTYSDWR